MEVQARLEDPVKMARLEDKMDQAKMGRLEDQVKMGPASPYDMGDRVKCATTGPAVHYCERFWDKYPGQGQKFDGVCRTIKGNIICTRFEKKCTRKWYGAQKCFPIPRYWAYRCSPEGPCRLVPLDVKGDVIQGKIGTKEGDVIQGKIGIEAAGNIGTNDQAEKFKQAILGAKRDGYCAEGTICGSPVYGRPLWIWVLAVFVILLGLKAIDDS